MYVFVCTIPSKHKDHKDGAMSQSVKVGQLMYILICRGRRSRLPSCFENLLKFCTKTKLDF